jgi:hypothetical protein
MWRTSITAARRQNASLFHKYISVPHLHITTGNAFEGTELFAFLTCHYNENDTLRLSAKGGHALRRPLNILSGQVLLSDVAAFFQRLHFSLPRRSFSVGGLPRRPQHHCLSNHLFNLDLQYDQHPVI